LAGSVVRVLLDQKNGRERKKKEKKSLKKKSETGKRDLRLREKG